MRYDFDSKFPKHSAPALTCRVRLPMMQVRHQVVPSRSYLSPCCAECLSVEGYHRVVQLHWSSRLIARGGPALMSAFAKMQKFFGLRPYVFIASQRTSRLGGQSWDVCAARLDCCTIWNGLIDPRSPFRLQRPALRAISSTRMKRRS